MEPRATTPPTAADNFKNPRRPIGRKVSVMRFSLMVCIACPNE
ncbi:hypothetical protein YT1_0197 [Rhodococcus ruber]|nr:hypothetical protein YT1_0197 [Rhodococcus ruber]